MAAYTPIGCSDYDMLEIACMDRYEIEVQFDTGTVLGIADGLDVRSGEEFLRIRRLGGDTEDVRADRIHRITVLTRPARFTGHVFSTDDA